MLQHCNLFSSLHYFKFCIFFLIALQITSNNLNILVFPTSTAWKQYLPLYIQITFVNVPISRMTYFCFSKIMTSQKKISPKYQSVILLSLYIYLFAMSLILFTCRTYTTEIMQQTCSVHLQLFAIYSYLNAVWYHFLYIGIFLSFLKYYTMQYLITHTNARATHLWQ